MLEDRRPSIHGGGPQFNETLVGSRGDSSLSVQDTVWEDNSRDRGVRTTGTIYHTGD